MELSPEERQRIYLEEKARLEAQGQIKRQVKAKQTQKVTNGCGIGCLVILGLFVFFWIIGTLSPHGDKGSPHSDSVGAYVYAEEFVRRNLRAPSTAKFCGFSEANVIILGADSYQVAGWVDAQNGFGAMLRNNFVCKLHQIGTSWYLDDVSVVPR